MIVIFIHHSTKRQRIPASTAANAASSDYLTYTLFTNTEGQTGYKVALNAASRPSIEKVVIPETWEGKPVIEIAASGFMSCAKLKTVIIPASVKVIGATLLQTRQHYKESVFRMSKKSGANAFAMCISLEKLVVQNTVVTVGATILRNNSNTLYIQSSAIKVASKWSATWKTSFTGSIEHDVTPEDLVFYRGITDVSARSPRVLSGVKILHKYFLCFIV